MMAPLDRVFQPWELNPYELITWRDMLQFSAGNFFWVGRVLRSLREDCYIASARCAGNQVGFDLSMDIDDKARERALEHLPSVEDQFRHLGLVISAETAKELRDALSDKTTRRNFQWLIDQVDALEKISEKELKGKFFLYIPQERVRYWPHQAKGERGFGSLFGRDVADKFPSANFDIMSSGIAYGTSLTTSCVFHLMRVMEIGLAALGKAFGVSAAYTNWEVVLNQIESKIAGMRSDPEWKTLPDCKEQQEYYSQAASYFRTVKDAWRNYTMHVRAKYTEEEAEQIFNAVKGFMQKLAERLAE
jgi:hypothetical protein